MQEEISRSTSIYDRLYLYFFVLLPLVYSEKSIDPVLVSRQLFLTAFVSIVGLFVGYQGYKKKLNFDFSFLKLGVFLIFLIFLITIIISFSQSIVVSESVSVLSKYFIEILFFIITTFLIIQNQVSISSLVKSIVVFAGIVILLVAYQATKLALSKNPFLENISELDGLFGIKNLLASILFLTLPFLLNIFSSSKMWKKTGLLIAVFSILIILIIQTKAVIIATFVSFLVFIILSYKLKNISAGKIKNIIVSTFLLLMLVGLITFQNKQKFSHLYDKKSSIERVFIWNNTIKIIKDNVVLGVGLGNWQVHFPKYGLNNCPTQEIREGIRTVQRPHNDFLWVFSEAGIIGFLSYISIFITMLYYSFKLIIAFKAQKNNKLFVSFFVTIIGYFLIAFVDFPLERVEHQIVLYLIFSIITAQYYKSITFSETKNIHQTHLLSFFILLAIPVSLSFMVSVHRFNGEVHSKKIYRYENQSNWNGVVKEADYSINWFYKMDPMSAPINWYKGVALFSMNDFNSSRDCFEQAYLIHPYNIHVLNNLASCYESLKEHQKAIDFYIKALTISSEFEEARLNLSAVYFNTNEIDKAFETINKCSVDCPDSKYNTFLPVILNAWLTLQTRAITDEKTKVRMIETLNNRENITQLYFDSKTKNIKFDITYIIVSTNKQKIKPT